MSMLDIPKHLRGRKVKKSHLKRIIALKEFIKKDNKLKLAMTCQTVGLSTIKGRTYKYLSADRKAE